LFVAGFHVAHKAVVTGMAQVVTAPVVRAAYTTDGVNPSRAIVTATLAEPVIVRRHGEHAGELVLFVVIGVKLALSHKTQS
jgi:hypothetical protein